jgi:tripartite-type tricarboxylate transporter receptor subunit TctC
MKSWLKLVGGVVSSALLATTLYAPVTSAQGTYPDRPISLVVPFPAGGTPDILARILSEQMSTDLGQPVIVENKAGASGNLGAQYVARAKPDAYTLLVCAFSCAVSQSLYKPAPYDIVKDFSPVSLLATVPSVLVINPKIPAKTIQEFIAFAKSNPGVLNAASSGVGGSAHLALELMNKEAGTDITHVPYRGAGQVAADLLGGQVDMYFDNLPASQPHIKTGNLRALAVASHERSSVIPDVPTFIESGYPNIIVTPWFGLLAPAGVSPERIAILNNAVKTALNKPETVARLRDMGLDPAVDTPEQFTQFLQDAVTGWGTLIHEKGISNE